MATEKRLIDANDVYSLFDGNGTARLHVADIDVIPRVDAVEVIRCKDCKHFNQLEKGCDYHGYWYHVRVEADAFCSYGERRAEDG